MIERVHASDSPDGESERRHATYDRQRTQFAIERDELRRRWNVVGNIRLIAVIGAAAALFLALQFGIPILFAVAAAFTIAFVALVVYHRKLGRARPRAAALHDVNHEALLRMDRNWSDLPLRHSFQAERGHPFAGDLDLFGHASVFHLLETVETPMGAARLRDNLIHPASPDVVRERQQAVGQLAPELSWRQELAVRGRMIGENRPDPEPLLAWAESERWLSSRPLLRVAGAAGAVAFLASAALAIAGVVPWLIAMAIGIANLLLTQVFAPEARARINLVAEHFTSISQQADLLDQIERIPGDASWVNEITQRLQTDGHRASEMVRDLGSRAAFAVPAGTILYLPLQAAFAWDINVLARLESWQSHAGSRVRDWLAVIGDVEALCAFASLWDDEPIRVMPIVASVNDRLCATGLGHPLLSDTERVVNEVEVGPPGTFLLVTGSNMSGKSTLLRAIGVNLVLAGAGGPVCASSLSAPPVRLWTSVRVEDSLERGVSFFMAELQRLKQVVDAASAADPDGRRLVFLLDEILQGTNTAERQIAARRVIRHLVDEGAIGAVSTHDLTLAEGPELTEVARPVHLRDSITATGMSFDYKLRPGIATSTNALRLMDIVFGASR